MTVKLLTEQHLKFLSLKGGYTGSSESTIVKMSHCWKSHCGSNELQVLGLNPCPDAPRFILFFLKEKNNKKTKTL